MFVPTQGGGKEIIMKVTKYTSGSDVLLKKDEILPSGGEMGGIINIEVSDEIIGKVKGYGVALTGASCYELSLMEPDKRKEFLNDIYSENGMNLNVARLPIGSCDNSRELYTYDDVPFDTELIHFSIEREKNYILPIIKEILEINPNIKFFASPWSPPGWMKTGGSICGGYMRDKYIDVYAEYIIKYIEAYKSEGINIYAITPQNEPNTDQSGKFPACIWNPEQEAKFILSLSKKLEKKGIDLDIWLFDHNFADWRRPLWTIEEYPEILNYCSSVAFHYYSGCIEMVDNITEKYPNIKFQFTEGGPRINDNYSLDWCKWGMMMSKALNRGFESFTGWNLMLDEIGDPNIGPYSCGGLVTLNSVTRELTYSGQYKAFSHFSRFVKRNADVYRCFAKNDGLNMSGFPNSYVPIEVSAVKNEDGSFVLNIVNANNSKRQLQIFYNGKWWYIEAMENTISTIVFED